jgi:hypothetical protein
MDASKNVSEQNDTLHNKKSHKYPYWRSVLPTDLEITVIRYVNTSLGHPGTEKYIAQIANTFHVKGLEREVRKFISRCDTCQRLNIEIGFVPCRTQAICLQSQMTFVPLIFVGRYLLDASGFFLFLCVSTCFQNLLSCTH